MTEHEHQVTLMRWANLSKGRYPELRLMYAVPNGSHRNKVTAVKLKAEGLKAGVPDICLPVARGGHHALYIEMKRPKQGKAQAGRVSRLQQQWIDDLTEAGNLVQVCYGYLAAIEAIEGYLVGKTK